MAATNDNELGVKVKIEPSAVGFQRKLDKIGDSHQLRVKVNTDKATKAISDITNAINKEHKIMLDVDDTGVSQKIQSINESLKAFSAAPHTIKLDTGELDKQINGITTKLSNLGQRMQKTSGQISAAVSQLFGEDTAPKKYSAYFTSEMQKAVDAAKKENNNFAKVNKDNKRLLESISEGVYSDYDDYVKRFMADVTSLQGIINKLKPTDSIFDEFEKFENFTKVEESLSYFLESGFSKGPLNQEQLKTVVGYVREFYDAIEAGINFSGTKKEAADTINRMKNAIDNFVTYAKEGFKLPPPKFDEEAFKQEFQKQWEAAGKSVYERESSTKQKASKAVDVEAVGNKQAEVLLKIASAEEKIAENATSVYHAYNNIFEATKDYMEESKKYAEEISQLNALIDKKAEGKTEGPRVESVDSEAIKQNLSEILSVVVGFMKSINRLVGSANKADSSVGMEKIAVAQERYTAAINSINTKTLESLSGNMVSFGRNLVTLDAMMRAMSDGKNTKTGTKKEKNVPTVDTAQLEKIDKAAADVKNSANKVSLDIESILGQFSDVAAKSADFQSVSMTIMQAGNGLISIFEHYAKAADIIRTIAQKTMTNLNVQTGESSGQTKNSVSVSKMTKNAEAYSKAVSEINEKAKTFIVSAKSVTELMGKQVSAFIQAKKGAESYRKELEKIVQYSKKDTGSSGGSSDKIKNSSILSAQKDIGEISAKILEISGDASQYSERIKQLTTALQNLMESPTRKLEEFSSIVREISSLSAEVTARLKRQAKGIQEIQEAEPAASEKNNDADLSKQEEQIALAEFLNLQYQERAKSAQDVIDAARQEKIAVKEVNDAYNELMNSLAGFAEAKDNYDTFGSDEEFENLKNAANEVSGAYNTLQTIVSETRKNTFDVFNYASNSIKTLQGNINTLENTQRQFTFGSENFNDIQKNIDILRNFQTELNKLASNKDYEGIISLIASAGDEMKQMTGYSEESAISINDLSDVIRMFSQITTVANSHFRGMKKEMSDAHASEVLKNQFQNLVNQINALYAANKRLAGTSVGNRMLDLVEKIKTGKTTEELTRFRIEYAKLITEAREQNLIGESALDKILKVFTGRVSNVLSGYAITAIIQGLRGMLQNVVEIDTAMTELKKVTDETSVAYNKFLDGAADRAKKLGVSISEIVNVTADWARLGNNMKDAQNLADYTILLKNVGDGIEDVNTASEYLISTLNGFQMDNSQIQNIVDVINQVANTEPVSANDIGAILQRSSAAMSAANNTFEETVALGTAMNSIVQNAEVTGTALRSLSMYLRAAKTEAEDAGVETEGMAESVSELRDKLLKLTGVDIQAANGDFKSTYQIMKELAGVWKDLSDVSQANVLEMIAGKRNAQSVSGLLSAFDIADDALNQTQNAVGSAAAENEKYLQSIAGKVAQFTAAFEALSQTVVDSGLIKGFVDFGTALLNVANGAVKLTGTLPALTGALTGIVGVVNTVNVSKGGKMEVPAYACCDFKVA